MDLAVLNLSPEMAAAIKTSLVGGGANAASSGGFKGLAEFSGPG